MCQCVCSLCIISLFFPCTCSSYISLTYASFCMLHLFTIYVACRFTSQEVKYVATMRLMLLVIVSQLMAPRLVYIPVYPW